MPRKLQSRTCPICLSDPAEVFCEVRGNDRLDTSASEAQLPGNTIVYRCKNCTLGWIDPVPSARELAGYYTSSYLGDVASTVEGFLAGQLQRSRSWKNELDKARLVERFRFRIPGHCRSSGPIVAAAVTGPQRSRRSAATTMITPATSGAMTQPTPRRPR